MIDRSGPPGVFGAVNRVGREDIGTLLSRMAGGTGERFCREMLVDSGHQWAIGRVHLGVLQPHRQLHAEDAVHVLFHGDLYNLAEHLRHAPVEAEGRPRLTRIIASLYDAAGSEFVRELDGVFAVVIVDTRRHRVIVATDLLGSFPLYWRAVSDDFVFGSSLAAVLEHPATPKALNPDAVADYLAFGHPLGVKTLAAGVDVVPPGTTLCYDWDNGTVTVSRYARIADAFVPWTSTHGAYEEALVSAFRESVQRALSGGHAMGLSLSGGLDSRAILSALNGHCAALETYTLGVKGCADEVIAEHLASIAGTHHTFFELDERYLREFLPNLHKLVDLTDGMYLSHGLTEMLALEFLSSPRFRVLLRGHGGELAKTNLAWPFHTDERVHTFHSTQEFVPYMLDRVNYISRGLDLRQLLTAVWFERIDGRARHSLEQSVYEVDLSAPDLCSYLYLNEHHRRVTTASLEVFRQVVEVRQPFVDPVFLRVLFRGNPAWRADTGIHRALTKAGNSALLRMRNSNTGAPADAGPAAEWWLDKFNTLFKRLRVRGYRHYHNFQNWMSRQLLSSVDEVLLNSRSLDRGVLREAGVRRLLDETRAHTADHSYLLQTLLILELWQQQNLDS